MAHRGREGPPGSGDPGDFDFLEVMPSSGDQETTEPLQESQAQPKLNFILTVSGSLLCTSKIAKLRPLRVGALDYTEATSETGHVLGVIIGHARDVASELEAP